MPSIRISKVIMVMNLYLVLSKIVKVRQVKSHLQCDPFLCHFVSSMFGSKFCNINKDMRQIVQASFETLFTCVSNTKQQVSHTVFVKF